MVDPVFGCRGNSLYQFCGTGSSILPSTRIENYQATIINSHNERTLTLEAGLSHPPYQKIISEGVPSLEGLEDLTMFRPQSDADDTTTMLIPAGRTQDRLQCSGTFTSVQRSDSKGTSYNFRDASLRHCRYTHRDQRLSPVIMVWSVDSYSASGVQVRWLHMGCWTFVGSAMSAEGTTNCRSAVKRVAAHTCGNTVAAQALAASPSSRTRMTFENSAAKLQAMIIDSASQILGDSHEHG